MESLAGIGRVSDRHIQNFVRMVQLLDGEERTVLRGLVESSGKGMFVEALTNRIQVEKDGMML
jgi:hypothetical protein